MIVVRDLVAFDGPLPTVQEPQLAPNDGGWAPPRPVDYRHNVRDIRSQQAINWYTEDEKDLRLEQRFWCAFHFFYYESILFNKYLKKKFEPPVVPMKCFGAYALGKFEEPELRQMVGDLRSMGLIHLLEFKKDWNNELIMQFYASYYHLRDKTGDPDVIHWTTEGKHYQVDFCTFARLLSFNGSDRRNTELIEYEDLAMEEYQHMYHPGHAADGQKVFLKPYYYVLNNILRHILYPKMGDSTFLRDDSEGA